MPVDSIKDLKISSKQFVSLLLVLLLAGYWIFLEAKLCQSGSLEEPHPSEVFDEVVIKGKGVKLAVFHEWLEMLALEAEL